MTASAPTRRDKKWRIYYSDFSTFSSDDGTPWDAPRQDVQVIIQSDNRVGWHWVSGGDYFYWDPDRGGWITTDMIIDHLISCKHPCVLLGRQMSDERWAELFQKVKQELGEKQGWLSTEDRRSVNQTTNMA